jgi:phage terminase large subunit GpA-like protein
MMELTGLALDPAEALTRAGYHVDPWQLLVVRLLGRPRRPNEASRRVIVTTARQVGKTLTISGAVTARLVLDPGVLVVVVSASEKQAAEVNRHVRRLLAWVLVDVGDVTSEPQTSIELSNGSRLVVVAASSSAVRGWSAGLLVIDEAAYVA